jgi:hydrogenase-4 component H
VWITAKIKQLLLVLKPGIVTLKYPFESRPVPKGFRGAPKWDHNKCIGCGGCANHCSARTILIRDVCQELRVMLYDSSRCTYCGRCAEVCPEDAITITDCFEEATDNREDLTERLELFMLTCKRCGRCFDMETGNRLDRLHLRGYRYDNLEARALIPRVTDQLDTRLLKETECFARPDSVSKSTD